VLGQGLRTIGIGAAIGIAGSLALSRYLESLLFGVTARDLGVLAASRLSCSSSPAWPATSRATGDEGRSLVALRAD
jgi:hypothetical protein